MMPGHMTPECGNNGHGKYTSGSLFLNISLLFKNRMIDLCKSYCKLMTNSKRTRDTAILFCKSSVRTAI